MITSIGVKVDSFSYFKVFCPASGEMFFKKIVFTVNEYYPSALFFRGSVYDDLFHPLVSGDSSGVWKPWHSE